MSLFPAFLTAFDTVRAALLRGDLTCTELPGDGAILMLAERDEMLTINVSGAWCMNALQSSDTKTAEQLTQLFADHFNLAPAQAARDVADFLSNLAQRLT
jgi:hypothetical protein